MRAVLLAGGVAVALAVMLVARVAIKSYLAECSDFVRTPPTAIARHPQETGIPGLHEVGFAGPDGLALAGWYVPSRNGGAVVLVHGTQADRSALLPETRWLAEAGFGVLAIDLPGQGASAGRSLWGEPEQQAIQAAVAWLARRAEVKQDRIGGFGLSLGGYVLTQAAAREPGLRALVLVSTPTDIVEETRLASSQWGPLSALPAVWALRRSGMPLSPRAVEVVGAIAAREVLVIGGELDSWVPPRMTRALYAAAREPKSLWLVPGAGHSDFSTVAAAEYRNRLVSFFCAALLPPARGPGERGWARSSQAG